MIRFKPQKGMFSRPGHCIAVAEILRYMEAPEKYVLAGLLHDLYEDVIEGKEKIEERVRKAGYEEVLEIVREYFTEDKSKDSYLSGAEEFEKVVHSGDEWLVRVLIADKLVSALVMNDPQLKGHRDYSRIRWGVGKNLILLGRCVSECENAFGAYLEVKEVIVKEYRRLRRYSRATEADFLDYLEGLLRSKNPEGSGNYLDIELIDGG